MTDLEHALGRCSGELDEKMGDKQNLHIAVSPFLEEPVFVGLLHEISFRNLYPRPIPGETFLKLNRHNTVRQLASM